MIIMIMQITYIRRPTNYLTLISRIHPNNRFFHQSLEFGFNLPGNFGDLFMDEIESLGSDSKDTHLFLDLRERDPDDGMTNIAYEKGRLFLKAMEDYYGREKFDAFLRKYFEEHGPETGRDNSE